LLEKKKKDSDGRSNDEDGDADDGNADDWISALMLKPDSTSDPLPAAAGEFCAL
jgi:hypothetical protein